MDSLKHYISGPTYKDKKNYNEALLNYAENTEYQHDTERKRKQKDDTKTKNSKKSATNSRPNEPTTSAITPFVPNPQKVNPENSLIPMFAQDEDDTHKTTALAIQTQHSNIVNQMCQASHMFQNALFTNCNFTFQLPK